jgi:hypothetical protein
LGFTPFTFLIVLPFLQEIVVVLAIEKVNWVGSDFLYPITSGTDTDKLHLPLAWKLKNKSLSILQTSGVST